VSTLYRPDLLYSQPAFTRGPGLLVSPTGTVLAADTNAPDAVVDLPGKALFPGFVNAHSHSFQRLIRGKSESRAASGRDFWSWRGTMYHAAAQLDPQDVYDVARMAFLEMLLSGTTTVGEFHYLHNAPGGRPYDDPNLLSKQIIAAAQSVGIRIVLLRSAYLRSGYELPLDPGQIRFFESASQFLDNMAALSKEYPADSTEVRFGVAPHSLRAVPLRELKEIAAWARERKLPLHMHVAEQVGENEACLREYGLTPVALLGREGLLAPDFTAVHAIHITADEIELLAKANATVC
jgi:formimidoylglutamate deiminase